MTSVAMSLYRLRTHRPSAMLYRNVLAYRRMWLLILTGAVEPLLYLVAFGVGVGELVGTIELSDGRVVEYDVYVAPAMLANAAMLGPLFESSFNVFAKLKWAKLYDGILNTPMRPWDVALGEAAWALIRGGIYIAMFMAVMAALGLLPSAWAVLAIPSAMLVGAAFVGIGLTVATVFRNWPDFDWMMSMVFVMFLFGGTFIPVDDYPAAAQWLVYTLPLYHGIELVRGLCLGILSWTMLINAAYLIALGAVGTSIAQHRMAKALYN